MQQWKYCALQLSNNQLKVFSLETDRRIEFFPVPRNQSDPIDSNNASEVIRKWTAILGLQGWELVSVITIEKNGYQEWIFKRPTDEINLSSLWKEETP